MQLWCTCAGSNAYTRVCLHYHSFSTMTTKKMRQLIHGHGRLFGTLLSQAMNFRNDLGSVTFFHEKPHTYYPKKISELLYSIWKEKCIHLKEIFQDTKSICSCHSPPFHNASLTISKVKLCFISLQRLFPFDSILSSSRHVARWVA